MSKLRRFSAVAVLALLLELAVFGQTPSCEPGQTSTPPCTSGQSVSDDPAPGETQTPPDANSADVFTISEVAVDLLLSAIF